MGETEHPAHTSAKLNMMKRDLKILAGRLLKFVIANTGIYNGMLYGRAFQLMPAYWSMVPLAEQEIKRAGLPTMNKISNW